MRRISGLSGEISRAGADADRAVAARVGGDRGTRPRAGRHRAGGAGHGYFDVDDHPRAQRVAGAGPDDCGARAAAGWRPEADDRQGSHAAARLEGLVEPTASGDPQSPLRWTAKSVRQLARTLQTMGHRVCLQLVAELLTAAGYSLQANQKTREGSSHPDPDAQFRHIIAQVRHFQAAGQPVISVDTKKKELVGGFKIRARCARWASRTRARARLSDSRTGQGYTLRGLRSHPQRRLGKRRD